MMRSKMQLIGLMFVVFAFFLTGCQSKNQTAQTDASNAANSASPNGDANAPAASPPAVANPPAASAPAPAPTSVDIPAGTTVAIRLRDTISSGTVQAGAPFEGTLAKALAANGAEVAPRGSAVRGRIAGAVSSGRLDRPAELALVLTSVTPPGAEKVAIETNTWSMTGKSHKKRDVAFMGGGAAGGGLIGALAGGKKGALIGTLVGGGGGTAAAASTGKQEIVLASETELSFKLARSVSFPIAR